MINITGLTKEHVKLLDRMWELEEASDYDEWKDSLSEETRNTVYTLEELMKWAFLDDITDVSKAVAFINGIRRFGPAKYGPFTK